MTFKQADETLLHVNHVANSQYSFYTTTDGRVLLRDSVGNLCYAKQIGNQLINTGIAAHEEGWQSENERSVKRTAAKLSNVLNSLQTKRLQALQRDSSLKNATKSADGLGRYGESYGGAIPSVGGSTIPFVLVEFADITLQDYSTIDKYESYFNDAVYKNDEGNIGSVSSYFNMQSRGLLNLTFKCVGKIRLSRNRAFYGKNSAQGKTDENRYVFVQEVLDSITASDVDLEDFNVNGSIPNICIIFAGPGEQSSYDVGAEDYLWAHFSSKSFKSGNCTVNSYFVGNELYEDYFKEDGSVEYADPPTNNYLVPQSVKTVGIGVICHELSHALGLPDFYYTGNDPKTYNACETMKYWSPLDYGYFFKDGYAPVGFTAYERNMLGWLKIKELNEAQSATLHSFCTDEENTGETEAYLIRNPMNEKEYYILENRQTATWYPKAMGHGLLITHIDYDANAWRNNTVNNDPLHQRYAYVAADNKKGIDNLGPTDLKGDLFPGLTGKTEFTDTTVPASDVYTTNGKLGKPIYNISEKDGAITFDFIEPISTGISSGIYGMNNEPTYIYTIDGRKIKSSSLEHGLYIVKAGKKTSLVIGKSVR